MRPPRGRILSGESDSKRPMDRVLSVESRNITYRVERDGAESLDSSDNSRPQSWDNTSETTSNSDVSEIAIHSLLVDWKQRGLDREMHQDPDRDRYTSDEEGTVIDNAVIDKTPEQESKEQEEIQSVRRGFRRRQDSCR